MSLKIMIADEKTGEVFGVSEINSNTIQGMKHAISYRNVEDLYVFEASDNNVAEYFKNYLNKRQIHCGVKERYNEGEIQVVGVSFKPLLQLCEELNNIRPLHICQGIAATITNLRYAIKHDKDGILELINRRLTLYSEAKHVYGLSMKQINYYMWGEFRHDITDYKFVDFEYKRRFRKEIRKMKEEM